jgi:hypothetical protein
MSVVKFLNRLDLEQKISSLDGHSVVFGNKEGLCREALVRSAQKRVAQMHSVLKNAKSVGEGIYTIFEGVALAPLGVKLSLLIRWSDMKSLWL